MSMLDIYSYVNKTCGDKADMKGTGEINYKEQPFPVTLNRNSKHPTRGKMYCIKQGTHVKEPCRCESVSQSDDDITIATFVLVNTATDEIDTDEANVKPSLATIQQLHSLLESTRKSVSISIDQNDLIGLRKAKYRLCFAKKIAEGEYNVVWQSYVDFLENNTFSWQPVYQIFGTNTFERNIRVEAQTNTVDIGLGEESFLDEFGVLSEPRTGDEVASIKLVSEYSSIHPGVNQISTGIDKKAISTPIYVAKNAIVAGEATLTPIERVLVWFEQHIETSTMFSQARSREVEIDLTRTNSTRRHYQGGRWSTP